MIVVSFLDDSSGSAMRFAMPRPRVETPKARIVLGLSADPDEHVDSPRRIESAHADPVAPTIHEAHRETPLAAVAGGLHLDDLSGLPEPAPAAQAG
ncbi:MAG: hypothetical protein IPL88_09135 [Rhizobiales bacterium]|nr:hypothetical protein [Hyphomicrobiales bacterium]